MLKFVELKIVRNGWEWVALYPNTNTGKAQRQADSKEYRESGAMPKRHWTMKSVGPAKSS